MKRPCSSPSAAPRSPAAHRRPGGSAGPLRGGWAVLQPLPWRRRAATMIAGRIRERRGELGLSLKVFALRLGVAERIAGRYEKGTHLLDLQTLFNVAAALEVPARHFLVCLDLAGAPEPLEPENLID